MIEPLLLCTTDFTVNNTLLSFQPFSIRLVSVAHVLTPTTGGLVQVSKRPGGRRLVVQFGETVVSAETVALLRTVFASRICDLAWTEPTGEAFTFHAAREPIRAVWQWDQPGFFQPLILTFRERPPAPAIP